MPPLIRRVPTFIVVEAGDMGRHRDGLRAAGKFSLAFEGTLALPYQLLPPRGYLLDDPLGRLYACLSSCRKAGS